jgi:hypothetical protein
MAGDHLADQLRIDELPIPTPGRAVSLAMIVRIAPPGAPAHLQVGGVPAPMNPPIIKTARRDHATIWPI